MGLGGPAARRVMRGNARPHGKGRHRGCRWPAPLLLAIALAGCGQAPVRSSLPSQWLPSPNHDDRRPAYVILHHTGGSSAAASLATLTDPRRGVSAHYLVGRDGRLYQLVDERQRAWHAGESDWGGDTDVNSASIGIELDNDGSEPFAEPQIETLLALLRDLSTRYPIPPSNVLGHGDVAPQRKVDPSRLFPWRRLAENGFGLWCDPPYPPAPPDFDPLLGLRALGYDVADPAAAIAAFKRHFSPDSTAFDAADRDRLYCLIGRRR